MCPFWTFCSRIVLFLDKSPYGYLWSSTSVFVWVFFQEKKQWKKYCWSEAPVTSIFFQLIYEWPSFPRYYSWNTVKFCFELTRECSKIATSVVFRYSTDEMRTQVESHLLPLTLGDVFLFHLAGLPHNPWIWGTPWETLKGQLQQEWDTRFSLMNTIYILMGFLWLHAYNHQNVWYKGKCLVSGCIHCVVHLPPDHAHSSVTRAPNRRRSL